MAQEPIQKQPGLLELVDELEKQGASDVEIVQRMRRYLNGKAREENIPLHGTFELTPLCNLDCKMCYVHLSEKQLHESGMRLLTVEEWKNIMQQAIDAGMMSATLTGGECLTYPGFDELYLFLQERGIETVVKTNGILLTSKRVGFFRQHPPSEIQITVYGSDEDTYEQVAGHRSFAQVMSAIHRSKGTELPLSINVTPNRYMAQDSENLIRLLSSIDIPYHINLSLFAPRPETERDGQDMDMTLDDYFKMYRISAELTGESLVPVCAEDIPLPQRKIETISGLPCNGGRNSFAVYWTGKLYPCPMLNKWGIDLKSTTFIDAWKGINDYVRAYPFPGECIGCEFQPLCPACIVLHEMGGIQGRHNPVFCARARLLIAEGFSYRTSKRGGSL